MDTSYLRGLASRLAADGERAYDLAAAVDRAAHHADWSGPAADAFRNEATDRVMSFRTLGGELHESARALVDHAAAVDEVLARQRLMQHSAPVDAVGTW